MGIEETTEVCATCQSWTGKREKKDTEIIPASNSAKALCTRLKKLKQPRGGCNNWEKWSS